jgi:predicted alpha/beta-fold hydrolase
LTPERFRPAFWLPGPHLQTIVPSVWPGPSPDRPSESLLVRVAPRSKVRVDVDRPGQATAGTLLLVHGMCGSSASGYMLRTARTALAAGWTVARMNLRNCGGTEALSDTLYNAGQSDDVGAVLETLEQAGFPRPFGVAGFSMGGNLVLRYVALAEDGCLADAAVGVNPPVDLDRCARAIESPRNRFYQSYYVWRLCRQLRRIAAVRPIDRPLPAPRDVRSVRRFDDAWTAPDAGHDSAADYYRAASAAPLLEGVRRPALVLSAVDDPFVPYEMFVPHHGAERIEFAHPASGGHCGYVRAARPRFWAGETIVGFLASRTSSGARVRVPSAPAPIPQTNR